MPKFHLKKPQEGESRKGRRKTFSIFKETDGRGSIIKSPDIDSVNKKFLEGILTRGEAEKHLRKVIERLEREAGIYKAPPSFHGDNRRILDLYWKEEYEHRQLEDPQAARDKLELALRALGEVSILVGTQSEIQKAVNQFKGNKQRMVVGKINALLIFVKRKHEIRLTKARAQKDKVHYLNEEELKILVEKLEDPRLKLLVQVLFYTGMRLGEAFAVDPRDIKPDKKTVYVDTQLTRDDEVKNPKWGSERSVYLVEPAAELLVEWAKVRHTFEVGRGALLKYVKRAARSAFPNQPEKHCTLKDLRHSYAIHLLIRGVSLSLIAQSLGNSESVCQRHYAGFVLNPDSVEAIDSILKKK